jgi:hypothetical protein
LQQKAIQSAFFATLRIETDLLSVCVKTMAPINQSVIKNPPNPHFLMGSNFYLFNLIFFSNKLILLFLLFCPFSVFSQYTGGRGDGFDFDEVEVTILPDGSVSRTESKAGQMLSAGPLPAGAGSVVHVWCWGTTNRRIVSLVDAHGKNHPVMVVGENPLRIRLPESVSPGIYFLHSDDSPPIAIPVVGKGG